MSWRTMQLGELIENFSVRARDYDAITSSLEFFGVSNEEGINKSKYAAENKADDYKIIEKGCFAYNPYRINVGSVALLEENVSGLISPAYVVFKAKPKTIIPQLLLKFLKSTEGLRQIKLYARGTVRQALRFEDLCKIEITLPSYEEQLLFFERFKSIETNSKHLSDHLSHQLDLVKQLRQAFLREAMQGKLVPQNPNDEPASVLLEKIKAEKETWIKNKIIKRHKPVPPILEYEVPFDIPDNWVWCRMGEFAYITSGSTPKSTAFVNDGIPFLKMYNLRNQKIDFYYNPQYIKEEVHNGELKRCRAFPGDLIMNIVGPPLGKLAIIPNNLIECNFNQAAVLIRPTQITINRYLFWYLSEMSEINEVETKGVAGQNNISVTQAHNMKIPLPPLNEQHRIVAKLDELMRYCDRLEEQIKTSQQQNDLLLQQVLREALQPQPKTEEEELPMAAELKVVYKNPKAHKVTSRKCDHAERAILAGHIINKTYREDFGRVKFQKLLHLTEYHCQIDIDSNYVQKVAGPYDRELIKDIESTLKRFRFFEIKESNRTGKRVTYRPLAAASELDNFFRKDFSREAERIDSLLNKFARFSYEECEIISTLYAVWNNRIIRKHPVTDELLKQDFLEWDKHKAKYTDRLDKALEWMEKEDIIPVGWGKLIEKPVVQE